MDEVELDEVEKKRAGAWDLRLSFLALLIPHNTFFLIVDILGMGRDTFITSFLLFHFILKGQKTCPWE